MLRVCLFERRKNNSHNQDAEKIAPASTASCSRRPIGICRYISSTTSIWSTETQIRRIFWETKQRMGGEFHHGQVQFLLRNIRFSNVLFFYNRAKFCRCGLPCVPSLKGRENVQFISLQHNLIARIDSLASFRTLKVLNLYDNKIERISGLDTLSSLRVLMLGKNRY